MLSPFPKIITIQPSDTVSGNGSKPIQNYLNNFNNEFMQTNYLPPIKYMYNQSQGCNTLSTSSLGLFNSNIQTDSNKNGSNIIFSESKNENIINLPQKYLTEISLPFFYLSPVSNVNEIMLENNKNQINPMTKGENLKINKIEKKSQEELSKNNLIKEKKNYKTEISLMKFGEEFPQRGSMINNLYNFKPFNFKESNKSYPIKSNKRRSTIFKKEFPIKIKLYEKKCKSPSPNFSNEKIKFLHNLKFKLAEGDKESENIDSFSEEDENEAYEKGYNHMPNTFSEMFHIFKKDVQYDKTIYKCNSNIIAGKEIKDRKSVV